MENNNLKKLYAKLNYIVLFVTHDCNLRCTYCFNELGEQKNECNCDFDTSEESLSQLAAFINKAQSPKIEILFYGGEPLFKWDKCKTIYDYLKQNCPDKKFIFKLQSNITLLNERILDEIIEREIKIFISIDGNQQSHDACRIFPNGKGSWDAVMKAMDLIKSRNYEFNVYNVADSEVNLAENVISIFEKGADRIRTMIPTRCSEFTPFEFDSDALENEFKKIADYLLEHPDKKYMNFGSFSFNDKSWLDYSYNYLYKNNLPLRDCMTFHGRIYINSNGDFLSCSALVSHEDSWGNLYKLEEGINGKYNIFDKLTLPECVNCKNRTGCRRCPYRLMQSSGSFAKCDVSNKKFAAVMTKVLKYMFKRAKEEYNYL